MEQDDIERAWNLFFPNARRNMERIKSSNARFVHYTSAESGVKILRSNRMLLRNSSMMNDFSEVQHGMDCLSASYNSPLGERLKSAMKQVQEDLPEIFEGNFNDDFGDVRSETYLLSISEHGDPIHGDELEDAFGRLSMWRAYANQNGVAFVFHNKPFLTETNALNAFSNPVVYATPETFAKSFEELVCEIESNLDFLIKIGGAFLHESLMNAFRFAVQSTKHPSFREEREWRVIYAPTLLDPDTIMVENQATKIPTEIMTLGGVPQRVYAIPFVNHPDEGFVGATIPELIDRILIGPSPDAYHIAQAFVSELSACGVEDASQKVFVTGVPLRV